MFEKLTKYELAETIKVQPVAPI